jgi:hypothetical protein
MFGEGFSFWGTLQGTFRKAADGTSSVTICPLFVSAFFGQL